jgi:glycosyltransferase involved in cell wall biosynthesis
MNQKHSERATIYPVVETAQRPLWSVMIPTYNCANYLRTTLASVLAQDPGADVMQIEVVDDGSTKDNPAAVVEELGKGRVAFYQQPQNVGYIRNFETCLQRSHGQIIHLLHGDDCVRDGFYQKLQRPFLEHPNLGAAFCRHIHMDEEGNWHYLSPLEESNSGILENWLEKIAVRQRIQTPSIVVRREVYEKLGGFDRRIRYWGEDWEMWVRIASQYPVWYEIEPLALYRTHSNSLSGHSVRTGANIQDFRQAIGLVKEYLPRDQAKKLSEQALENYALYAIDTSQKLALKGDMIGAIYQVKEAFRCRLSWKLIRRIIKLLIKMLDSQPTPAKIQPELEKLVNS